MNTSIAATLAATRPATDRQPVTRLLTAWQSGDSQALERLTSIIYDELRKRAQRFIRSERRGHTLQATAVVNEAFTHLLKMQVPWNSRRHFYAIAARQMRRVLVDHAKMRASEKRGGGKTESLEACDAIERIPDKDALDLVEIDDALSRLGQHDARLAAVIELHYFVGLTSAEIAKSEGVSEVTVDRSLRMGRAWLLRQLRPHGTDCLAANK